MIKKKWMLGLAMAVGMMGMSAVAEAKVTGGHGSGPSKSSACANAKVKAELSLDQLSRATNYRFTYDIYNFSSCSCDQDELNKLWSCEVDAYYSKN